MAAPEQHAYVLRIWLEPSEPRSAWRASVRDVRSRQTHYFSSPEALAAFLQRLGTNPAQAVC